MLKIIRRKKSYCYSRGYDNIKAARLNMLIIVILHKRGVSYINKKYIRLLKYFFLFVAPRHNIFCLIIVIISSLITCNVQCN